MAKPGKRAPINLVEVEKLAALHVTDVEMAGWFSVSVRTIERRKKNRKFAAAIERGRAKGKISIRRMQMQMLQAGNSTMGVWLGKQILGQNDYPQPLVTAVNSVLVLPSSIHAGQVGMEMTESIEVEQGPSGADLIDGRLQPTIDLVRHGIGAPDWKVRG